MNTKSLMWYFDRQLRQVNDQKFKGMKVPEKIAYLNRAIQRFYDEIFERRDEDPLFEEWLSPFDVVDYKGVVDKVSKDYVLYKKPDLFQSMTSVLITAKKGRCTASFEANPLQSKSGPAAFKNAMWEPSFEFEQTFRTMEGRCVRIYKKEFDIIEALFTYVRRPRDIHHPSSVIDGPKKGAYVYHGGEEITNDVDVEFEGSAFSYIADIAVLYASDVTGDLNLQINKILNIKNIKY